MDATNNIANDLFYKIRSRFSGLKLGTAQGLITINPEEARFFDFDYKDDDAAIGHVSISLAEENSMKVYFSTGITESMDARQKRGWYGFLKELRLFAKRRLMAFDTRDIAKDNLDKRDYAFLSQNSQSQDKSLTTTPVGESTMNESQMYGTKTVSYQKLLDTRLIIKHSKALVDDQQPGARARNISALFVENQEGERFKYPFIHLAGARAMQRHVGNGGLPYDEVGRSIINMSEEIAQLKSFGNYVVRNDLMNSDTNDIVSKSQARLEGLREQIARLSKQAYYEQYKADFQESSPIEIPQSMVEEYTDKFTVRNFKEDIKSVFPIIYKLMQENSKVDYDDIVAMTTEDINDTADIDLENENDSLDRFEDWIMGLGESSPIQSNEEQLLAIKNLNKLTAQAFPAGADGINAVTSLKGIIDDPKLYAEIKDAAKADPQADARPMVKAWLEKSAPEIASQIDFGDMAEEPAAADPAAPEAAPEPAAGQGDDAEAAAGDAAVAAATGQNQMVTQSDDPDERNRKDSEDFDPYDVDNISDQDPRIMSGASRQGYMRSDKNFLTRVFGSPSPEGYWLLKFTNGVIVMIEPDKSGRRGDEDDYKIFSKDPNAQRYIDAAIDPDEWQGEDSDVRNKKDSEDDLPFDVDPEDKPPSAKDEFGNSIKHRARHLARKGMRQAMDVKEVAEFISSFYDRDSGTFPKGPEGVVVMVGKKFGEQAERVARRFVERMAPHQEQRAEQMQELARIRELAGMKSKPVGQISNEDASPKIDWNSDDVVTVKTKMGDYYVKDTPEGLMLMGEDVEGYFHSDQDGESREGYIDFVYNMDTGKMVESPDDWHDVYGYLSYDDVEEFVKEVTQEVKSKYGETYDEIKDEVEGSVSVEKESTVAEDDDDLEDLRAELRDAYQMMYDSASEGIDQTDHIADELGDFFDAVEESGDESLQQGYEMVRGTADTDPEEQAEALRKAMRLLDPPEPDVEIDRESINYGVNESSDDIYTINNPDMERDAETGREEPDQIEVKVEFSSYDDEFEIDKVIRLDTKEDITDKVSNDRDLYFSLVYDVQQREQGRERDYSESIQDDANSELDRIRKLSGIFQGLGY